MTDGDASVRPDTTERSLHLRIKQCIRALETFVFEAQKSRNLMKELLNFSGELNEGLKQMLPMAEKIDELRRHCSELESQVAESQSLREPSDTANEIFSAIRVILDQEPDAVLRAKFERLIEVVEGEQGYVARDHILQLMS
jgi:hypothetical protein